MASISANGSKGHHKFTLNVNETGTSTANNTSTVSFSLVLSPIQTGWDWNYSSTVPVTYSININGVTYSGNIMSYNGSSTVTIRSGSQTVAHNSDGSKSISFSFSISDKVGQSYTPGNASASGSMGLTTIARYPTLNSGSNFTDETNPTFSITTYGIYPMRVKLEAGGNTQLITRDIAKNVTGYTIVLTEEERNKLRALCQNSNSLTVRETVCAMSGNTELSANYKDYTMTIVNANPTFEKFTYQDTNSSVTNVTGNNQVLVKGLSNLQVTISGENKMVAKKEAIPKNYVTTIDTKNINTNYSNDDIIVNVGSITNAGSKRLSVRAYDSRNNSTEVYKDVMVYDYNNPIVNATVTRLNNFENTTTLKVDGSFTSLLIDNVEKNSVISVEYRYREQYQGWGNWKPINKDLEGNKFTCSNTYLDLDNTKAFEFEIRVTDKLGSTTISRLLDVGEAIFFISSNKKQCYINSKRVVTEDELSNTGIYRTSPVKVGTWHDGKDIYRVVQKNIDLSNIASPYTYGFTDWQLGGTVETPISARLHITNGKTTSEIVGYSTAGTSIWCEGSSISFSHSGLNGYVGTLIFEYTKK